MAVISGYHVDDYCVGAFRRAVGILREQLGAEKVRDFASIGPGDLIARVPPKISGDATSGAVKQIPVYAIAVVGGDFDDEGNLVSVEGCDHLYFQASACYLLDISTSQPKVEPSAESYDGMIDCFDGREIDRVKSKHEDLDDDLKGILYRLPAERLGLGAPDFP